MVRPHYTSQPGGKKFSRQVGTGNDSRVKKATELGHKPVPARREAYWNATAVALEEHMAKWRVKQHPYVQVGTWHLCDRCGLAVDARMEDKVRVHR